MSETQKEHRIFTVLYSGAYFIAVNKEQPVPMLKGKNCKISLQDLVRNVEVSRYKKQEAEHTQQNCPYFQYTEHAHVYDNNSIPIKATDVFLEAPHRIDERTSGIALFCKTKESLIIMNYLLQAGMVRKKYYALVETAKVPPDNAGVLRHRLYHDERTNKTFAKAVKSDERKNTAELSWKTMSTNNGFSMLEIVPHQGKTHQIRAQLAASGIPIIGDVKYGSHIRTASGFIMLHAGSLYYPALLEASTIKLLESFVHKQNDRARKILKLLLAQPIALTAPFPESEQFWAPFKQLHA